MPLPFLLFPPSFLSPSPFPSKGREYLSFYKLPAPSKNHPFRCVSSFQSPKAFVCYKDNRSVFMLKTPGQPQPQPHPLGRCRLCGLLPGAGILTSARQLVTWLLNGPFSDVNLLFYFNLLKSCPSWSQPRTKSKTPHRVYKTQPGAYFRSTFVGSQAVFSRNILGAKQLEQPPKSVACGVCRTRETRAVRPESGSGGQSGRNPGFS